MLYVSLFSLIFNLSGLDLRNMTQFISNYQSKNGKTKNEKRNLVYLH